MQNNRNSPHDVQSPDCQVLTQTYSPNLFSSRFWRVGEQWFLSLHICTVHCTCTGFEISRCLIAHDHVVPNFVGASKFSQPVVSWASEKIP